MNLQERLKYLLNYSSLLINLKKNEKEEDYQDTKEKCRKIVDFFEKNKQDLFLVSFFYETVI